MKVIIDNNLNNRPYNENLQIRFYNDLVQSHYSKSIGNINKKNLSFAGRDKLTRMPQALGFLIARTGKNLTITKAGKLLMNHYLFSDVITHQMLKFQLPSPLHTTRKENKGLFNVKPFLEILRLIDTLGYLTYKELILFGMTLTDYHNFNQKISDVRKYRLLRKRVYSNKSISIKRFDNDYRKKYIANIYFDIIQKKQFHTRETKTSTEDSFLKKKISNLSDYTDAVYRVLKLTGLIKVSMGKTMIINPNRRLEVTYALSNIKRNVLYKNYQQLTTIKKRNVRKSFDKYISNPTIPALWNDNKKNIIKLLMNHNFKNIGSKNLYQLKELVYKLNVQRRQKILKKEQRHLINELSTNKLKLIKDIVSYYKRISKKDFGDYGPALFEWNTWRAMSVLDHGYIKANFVPDDSGKPLSPAKGNLPDVFCKYQNFDIATEVTLTRGHTQFDAESESVTRHVGMLHKNSKDDRQTFGLFIAGKLDYSTIRFFYYNSIPIDKYYGEILNVIPLDLKTFIKVFKNMVIKKLNPRIFYKIHKYSISDAINCIDHRKDASVWYKDLLNRLHQVIQNK